MLPAAPSKPVSGRGFNRIDIGIADEWMFKLPESAHFKLVSVRESINSFGRLGCPKHMMVSPEFFALFN